MASVVTRQIATGSFMRPEVRVVETPESIAYRAEWQAGPSEQYKSLAIAIQASGADF